MGHQREKMLPVLYIYFSWLIVFFVFSLRQIVFASPFLHLQASYIVCLPVLSYEALVTTSHLSFPPSFSSNFSSYFFHLLPSSPNPRPSIEPPPPPAPLHFSPFLALHFYPLPPSRFSSLLFTLSFLPSCFCFSFYSFA